MTLSAMRSVESWRAGALAGLFAALSLAIGLDDAAGGRRRRGGDGDRARRHRRRLFASCSGLRPRSRRHGRNGPARHARPGPPGSPPSATRSEPPSSFCAFFGGGALAICAPLCARLAAPARFLACAAMGTGVAGAFALAFPACLHAPYADLDPRLVALWLDKVTESQTALEGLRTSPVLLAPVFAFVLLALAFGLGLVRRASGRVRFAILVLIAVTLAHLLTGLWQIRGVIGAVVTATPLMAACLAAAMRQNSARGVAGTLLLCLCVSPAGLMGIASGVAAAFSAPVTGLSGKAVPTCSSAARSRASHGAGARPRRRGHRPRPADPGRHAPLRFRRPLSPQRRRQSGDHRRDDGSPGGGGPPPRSARRGLCAGLPGLARRAALRGPRARGARGRAGTGREDAVPRATYSRGHHLEGVEGRAGQWTPLVSPAPPAASSSP